MPTPQEDWLKNSTNAEYFRELRAVLDNMPIDFDIQQRCKINRAFQKAIETAMANEEAQQHE